MASTSFITEAGHAHAPSSVSAAAGTNSNSTTTSIVTAHLRSNSNPGSNHPNPVDSSNLNSTSANNNSSSRTNSLRHQNRKADNNPNRTDNTILHDHRQNHNSSKLPAFRFADRKTDSLVRPNIAQHHIPPSPVSPRDNEIRSEARQLDLVHRQQEADLQRDLHDAASPLAHHNKPAPRKRHIPASSQERQNRNSSTTSHKSPPEHISQLSSSRTRASTFQTTPRANPLTPSSASKRPASFPDSPTAVATSASAKPTSNSRRHAAPPQSDPDSNGTPAGNDPALTPSKRPDNATNDWAQRQRELLLPKSVQNTKTEESRRSRPPVSFRAPNITTATSNRPVIPPIRSFRSSGSRKSLVLDMNSRRVSYDESSDGSNDPNHRDRTLRALEGRTDDDFSRMTPPDSAEGTPDENTGDIFMRIAREDATQRSPRDTGAGDEHSAVTRLTRSSQRRPFSAVVPQHQVSSPPHVPRRLSDQRETSRTRRTANEESAQQMTRELNSRGLARDQVRPSSNIDELSRTQSGRTSSLRPSPITPRTLAFHDSQSEVGSAYSRRRPSLTESSGGLPSRASQLRNPNLAYGQGRTYNSSPLAPRAVDVSSHHPTESSASTAAPSMIWDNIVDMKTRLDRLENAGKPSAASGQAMSRVSDDRPATAVTNATTMSASPKRGTVTNALQADASSTTSSQREGHPILLSAMSKAKGVVSSDVYSAIESAATDAIALLSMMGAPGQPGPISSGASTIGGGGSITDRQLRRKAESICRSLTELCLALTEEAPIKSTQVMVIAPRETEPVTSPTAFKSANLTSQRRPSAFTDQTLSRLNATPRAPSSLEQRRNTVLSSTPLASPRFAALPGTPTDGMGRKSSLLIARSRRAGTEEPEEQTGRKSSLLLRTRRAGTEEPEEGRKTSLLLRGRRGTINDDDEEESRFRAPSRAVTEVNGLRPLHRQFVSQASSPPDLTGTVSSALPRRRLVPPSLNSRLVAPSSPAVQSPSITRRFLDRSTPERDTNSMAEKLAEDRGQRHIPLSQTAIMNRTSSISRRRDSLIPSISSPNTQQAGAYR